MHNTVSVSSKAASGQLVQHWCKPVRKPVNVVIAQRVSSDRLFMAISSSPDSISTVWHDGWRITSTRRTEARWHNRSNDD